jgi:hypothetical protein
MPEPQDRSGFRDGWVTATIRSQRVSMDPVSTLDVDALHAHWTEPGVRRWLMDGEILPRERVREMIDKSLEMFRELRCGLFAIRVVPTSRPSSS